MYTPSQPAVVKPGDMSRWPNEPLPSVVIVSSEAASDLERPYVVGAVNLYGVVAVSGQPELQRLRWAAGLCDCCEACVPNCCMAWLCPCVALAQVYARMGLLPYSTALLRLSLWVAPYAVARLLLRFASVETAAPSYVYTVNGEIYYGERASVITYNAGAIWASYALLLLGHVAFSLPVWLARAEVRRASQIPGDACGDCCVAWWCPNCAIAQMATHVRSYRPGDCSFSAPPSVLPAYDRGGQ